MEDNNPIIPEFILLTAIKAGLRFIQTDYETNLAANTITNSYLYRICGSTTIERYNYFDQAVAVLFRESDHPRKLKVDLMYNMDFDKIPSIYITLPGEQHGQNALSIEEDPTPYYNVENDVVTGSVVKYTRRKNANYGIYITSDNASEATLLYHIIDCLIISMTTHLALSGLSNITQGGQDIQIDSEKIPKHLFIKALTIGLQYYRSAPSFDQNPIFAGVFFEGLPTGS